MANPQLKSHWHRDFESFDYFCQYVTDPPPRTTGAERGSCETDGAAVRFTQTNNYDEALKLLSEGWPEGLAEVVRYDVDTPTASGSLTKPRPVMALAGHAPNVGRYLQGRPDSMYRFVNQKVNPIVKIGFNCDVSAGVSTDAIQRRGGALLGLIEALERNGRDVEIWCCHVIRDYDRRFSHAIPIKRAGEYIEPDRLAFMACHPSVLRRLMFRVQESTPKDYLTGRYGYGTPVTDWPKKGDATRHTWDLYLGGIHFTDDAWRTPDDTRRWIAGQLKRQGIE